MYQVIDALYVRADMFIKCDRDQTNQDASAIGRDAQVQDILDCTHVALRSPS